MSKLMDELKYQLSKIDFTKYSGDEIEESVFVSEIHSFARSQAEKFAEWITTATAMCSSGFETQNFKYRTNDDSRTNVE